MNSPIVLVITVFISVLTLWRPWWGITGLLSGLVLFDRNFAYFSLSIFGFIVYLPEWVLFLYLLRSLIVAPRQRFQTVVSWPTHLWIAIAIYLIIGLISLPAGFLHYPAARVLRDSVLCFNSLWMVLIASETDADLPIYQMGQWLAVMGIVKALYVYFFSVGVQLPGVDLVAGQPAAYSMLFGFLFLGMLILSSWKMSFFVTVLTALCLVDILLGTVRSSWTGVAGGLALGFVLLWRKHRAVMTGRLGISIITVGFFVAVFLFSGNRIYEHLTKPVIFANISLNLPINSDQAASTAKTYVPRQEHNFIVLPSPKPPNPRKLPAAAKPAPALPPEVPKNPLYLIWEELVSFTQGQHSANVNTRLWMWRDAVSEVLSIGIFKYGIPVRELSAYHLPSILQSDPCHAYVPVSGKGLEQERVVLNVACAETPLAHPQGGRMKRALQPLFGFGFGKLYLPPEVVWVVNSPHRYDPHNSLIDIFYRMGALGLATFLALVFMLYRRGLKTIASLNVGAWQTRLIIFFMACLTMHLIHTLTDNTLENDFKGLWFWLFAGLLIAASVPPKKSSESDSKL